jgi:perosamine synthetase
LKKPLQHLPSPPRALIPLYRVKLSGNEKKYVNECLDTGWISSLGRFTEQFERAAADLTGAGHAIAVTSGTTALHLALHCLGIGPGDEVIVPTFTYVAPVNMIVHTGARPVFAECRRDDWLIDLNDVERRITPRTKAILAVHLFGAACDMVGVGKLAAKHGLLVVEDAAQGFGTKLHNRYVGTFGDAGIFSFYGNKTVTSGEGGMIITDDAERAALMRRVKSQGLSPTRDYWHDIPGFNYRMSNICAAIGLAQLERLDGILARKRRVAVQYRRLLAELPVTLQTQIAGTESSEWMMTCLLPVGADSAAVKTMMRQDGIETRTAFACAHQMPIYRSKARFPVSEEVSARGLTLPSYPDLTDDEIVAVVRSLRNAIEAVS